MKRTPQTITSGELMVGVSLASTSEYVRLRFSTARRALSCAVLNGGYCHADEFLNLRVPKLGAVTAEDPARTLKSFSEKLCGNGLTVGMMTAASMKSLRVLSECLDGETLTVLLTTGLDNARRAGDPAEHRHLEDEPPRPGTINIAVCTSASLTDAALVEVITIATEAKVAALQELGVKSTLSGELATGTGTDAIAVFAAPGAQRVRYAGKHTLLGERVAALVIAAIQSSVQYKVGLAQ